MSEGVAETKFKAYYNYQKRHLRVCHKKLLKIKFIDDHFIDSDNTDGLLIFLLREAGYCHYRRTIYIAIKRKKLLHIAIMLFHEIIHWVLHSLLPIKNNGMLDVVHGGWDKLDPLSHYYFCLMKLIWRDNEKVRWIKRSKRMMKFASDC